MGYSYDMQGRLCCDNCGRAGGVGKLRCPFGWCQAVALCLSCRKALHHELTAEAHRARGCEKSSTEFHRQQQEKEQMLDAGKYVRTAALQHDGRIKVVFDGRAGSIAYFMSKSTYHAIPLMTNATPQDFGKVGAIVKAETIQLCENRCKGYKLPVELCICQRKDD